MKTQIFSKIIACLIIVFSSLYSFAKTVYVNDGSQNNDVYTTAIGKSGNTGSKSSPFVSLKDALAVVASNDTIYVDAGKFKGNPNGSLTINKSGISIIGVSKELTIFDNAYLASPPYNTLYFLTISQTNILIKNISVKNYMDYSSIIINSASNSDSTFVRFVGCFFDSNTSDKSYNSDGGGAIYVKKSSNTNLPVSLKLEYCFFRNNEATSDNHGGAIFIKDDTFLHMKGCQFVCNNPELLTTANGGSLYVLNSSAKLENCVFKGSYAGTRGGIIYAHSSSLLKKIDIFNCSFYEAKSEKGSFLFAENNMSITIINSIIFKNTTVTSNGAGGSIYLKENGNFLNIFNSTIADNIVASGSKMTGILNLGNSMVNVYNSILWNNQNGQISGSVNLFNSIVDQSTGNVTGVGILSANPLFINSSIFDYRIQTGSPAINKGVSPGSPNTDYNGYKRDALSDIGAYEFDSPELKLPQSCNFSCNPVTYNGNSNVCKSSITISLNSKTGEDFLWYTKLSGGTVFHVGPSYTTSLLNTDTTLYVISAFDACATLVPIVISQSCPSCNTKISYPSDSICKSSKNPIPTVSDGTSGKFSSTTTDLVFKDATKGEIDLVASKVGKYTITFTSDAIPTCKPTFEITILEKPSKVDTISFVEPTCTKDGKVQIKSFVPTAKYVFNPAGLSISNSGLISGKSGSYKLAVSVAGCLSDSLDLIFAAVPGKPKISSADTTICMGTTLQLTGTGTAKKWALASNLGIASIDGNGKITPTKAGTVRVGYTNSLDCTDSSTVHIDPLAVAGSFGAKTDSICSNLSTKITLSGYTGKIQWQSSTDTTNSNSWTNIVGANSPSYDTPKLFKGNYFYRASVSSGTCKDTVKSIIKIVVVSDSPVIGSVSTSSDTICAGNFANLNFVNGVGKIKLEQSSNAATGPWAAFSGSTISPSNFKTQILNSTMFYKVSVSNGKCTNIDTVVKVVVIPIPADLIMSNITPVFCKSDKKIVSDLKQLTTNLTKKITWYDNANNSFNDKDTLISQTYFAEQSEGACKSVNRVSVNVKIVDLPKPQLVGSPINPSCTVAKGAVNINMPNNGTWYVKATPSSMVGSMKDTTATLTTIPYTLKFENLSPGSYILQLKDANGCLSRDTSFIINPQPTIPAQPALDASVIYCASNSYTLDKIVFNPKPNPSVSESIKYFDKNGVVITNPSLVTVKPNEKYRFIFNNGACDSKDTLKLHIPMDQGPTLASNGTNLSLTAICAVEKPSFNTLFAKLPGIDTSLYSFFITPDTIIKPINYLPNKTIIGSNGGNLQEFYYTLADKVNGCKNTVFAKLSFKLDEGPKNLNIKSSQLFCGFSNPTVAKLDTAATKAKTTNTFVWYLSPTTMSQLPSNTPLIPGTYYGAEKEDQGCESVERKPVLVTIENFGPTTLDPNNVYAFCKGSNKHVSDLPISPYSTTNFVWLDSYKKQIANPSITDLIQGTYYAAEFKNGCISDKSQPIEVKFESPIISITPSKLPTCGVGNGALTIIGADNNLTYQWYKNNITLVDSTKSYITNLPFDYTIEYKVIVKDKNGCIDSAKTKFSDCEPPGIPHVITLNKDGKNDVFKLHYETKYPNCKLSIFNRWGAMVYESKEKPYKDDWDGKSNVAGTLGSGELPTGTYFYLIDKGDGSALESGYVELVK